MLREFWVVIDLLEKLGVGVLLSRELLRATLQQVAPLQVAVRVVHDLVGRCLPNARQDLSLLVAHLVHIDLGKTIY